MSSRSVDLAYGDAQSPGDAQAANALWPSPSADACGTTAILPRRDRPQDHLSLLPSAAEATALLRQWQATKTEFAALLVHHGEPAAALRHAGLRYWQAGQHADAIQALAAALTFHPRDAQIWSDLAGVHHAAVQPIHAERCIRRAIALDPGQARSWLLLAALQRTPNGAAAHAQHAVRLDPALGEAHLVLGTLEFQQRRFDIAAASFRQAIMHGHADRIGYGCLAQALYMSGAFADSAAAFEASAALGPLDSNARRSFARARTLATIIDGRIADAVAAYPALAGPDAEDVADIMRDAFTVLSAFGYTQASIAVGRYRLAQDPTDTAQRYLLDAATGQKLTQSPIAYVEAHFDRLASVFDERLVDALHYHVPEHLHALLTRHTTRRDSVLDLGCGTGLAAAHLAGFGGRLTGVDIAARMIEAASSRGYYAQLVKADALGYLAGHRRCFDLIFAADMMIYFGALESLFAAVADALAPGGLFAFSIEESATGQGFMVLPSGRFAHAQSYVEAVASAAFEILDSEATIIRLEANQPVAGRLMVLRLRMM